MASDSEWTVVRVGQADDHLRAWGPGRGGAWRALLPQPRGRAPTPEACPGCRSEHAILAFLPRLAVAAGGRDGRGRAGRRGAGPSGQAAGVQGDALRPEGRR